jgi:hypothetical protein
MKALRSNLAVGLGVAALTLTGTQAMAASAKFTAAWEKDKVELAEWESAEYAGSTGTADRQAAAEEVMGTIHVANKKELMIGVSGIANLITFTEAKGKNGGGTSTTVAEGNLALEVRIVPTGADAMCGAALPGYGISGEPGALTFASRRQELSVTVDLDVVAADLTNQDAVDLAALLDIEGDVTVALGLDTSAAHHFNFVAPDLDQGTYDVVACFTGSASGSVTTETVDSITTDLGSGYSFVAIGKRMLTVQEVRAVQDDFIVVE